MTAALSIREYHPLAVVIAIQIPGGLTRFEMILAVIVKATYTNGELKEEIRFWKKESSNSALGRQREARNAEEYETRAPVGAARRTGPFLSRISPMVDLVDAVIHGSLSQTIANR